MPQYRGRGLVRNRHGQAEAVMVVDAAARAQTGEFGIRIGEETGVGRIEHPPTVTGARVE